MNFWDRLKELFVKKNKSVQAPLFIIQKDSGSSEEKEYNSLELAITNLEKDPNIPKEKLQQLRNSLENLKNKNSLRTKNGEIFE